MRSTRFRLMVVLVLLGLACWPVASGASTTTMADAKSAPAFPVTFKAANGTFTFKSRPMQIMSLTPTSTEMLYAIGAGPQVKEVDSYSTYPRGTPVTKLNGTDPNVEAIAKYHPDLVIVYVDTSGFNKQMADLKIPVLYEPPAANLGQAYQQYLTLGSATGHVAAAKTEVANVKAKVAHIVATAPRVPKGTTYYYELDPTYYSVTSSTFMGQLLGLLGLTSIANSVKGAAQNGGYPQLSAEFILEANPTYIVLADTICCKASAASVAARPGWSALSSVQHGRIIGLNDSIASEWGPRITVLLRDVVTALRSHKVAAAL